MFSGGIEEISRTEAGSTPVIASSNVMLSPAFSSFSSIVVMRGLGMRTVRSSVVFVVSFPAVASIRMVAVPVVSFIRALKKTTCSPVFEKCISWEFFPSIVILSSVFIFTETCLMFSCMANTETGKSMMSPGVSSRGRAAESMSGLLTRLL